MLGLLTGSGVASIPLELDTTAPPVEDGAEESSREKDSHEHGSAG